MKIKFPVAKISALLAKGLGSAADGKINDKEAVELTKLALDIALGLVVQVLPAKVTVGNHSLPLHRVVELIDYLITAAPEFSQTEILELRKELLGILISISPEESELEIINKVA